MGGPSIVSKAVGQVWSITLHINKVLYLYLSIVHLNKMGAMIGWCQSTGPTRVRGPSCSNVSGLDEPYLPLETRGAYSNEVLSAEEVGASVMVGGFEMF